jgi:hypothetical protein
VHHDEDCQIYINGVKALELAGYTGGYAFYNITPAARETLVWGGENTLAVHCSQTGGGQYIDVGFSTLLPTITAINNVEKPGCRIYPNPVKNILNIVREHPDMEIIGIYNILGRPVILPDACDTRVDVSALARGIYFLRLKTGAVHDALAFIKE